MDVFKSDIPGAVIVSKDSYDDDVYVIPAIFGVKTYIGCIEFGIGTDTETFEWDKPENSMKLNAKQCEEIYNDVPNDGTAWLVIPLEKDYVWERIDHLLKFQNEDDEQGVVVAELYEDRFNLRVGEKI